MLIIGHRGAAGIAPENSLEALMAGKDTGADALEFDIHLTKDHIPVIIHDTSLWRTHHKHFTITDHTLAELQALHPSPAVPTLKEALATLTGSIQLNIELKDKGSGRIVLDELRSQANYTDIQKTVLLSSFDPSELIDLRQADSEIRLALLQRYNPYAFVKMDHAGLSAVGFYQFICPAHAVRLAKNRGLFTYAYTVNNRINFHRLERTGIDAIVTDFPNRFTTK